MADKDTIITQELLHQLFDYYDGDLYWKIKKQGATTGKKLRSLDEHGRSKISINGKSYLVHRLIFLYHHGFLPKEIDHINGIRSDHRIENLRSATTIQNQQNSKIRKDNSSGIKGVYWNKTYNKWYAKLKVNSKSIHIGAFCNIIDAKIAIDKARLRFHGEYARFI